MESSEVRARSIITIVAVFGVGAVLGAGVTWLIISASGRGRGRSLRRSTASPVAMSEDGSGSGSGSGSGWTKRSRQRCSDQLRRILADHEVRLMEAVDKFVAHFSVTTHDHDQTSKSSRQLSQPEVARSNPQCVHFLFYFHVISNSLSPSMCVINLQIMTQRQSSIICLDAAYVPSTVSKTKS